MGDNAIDIGHAHLLEAAHRRRGMRWAEYGRIRFEDDVQELAKSPVPCEGSAVRTREVVAPAGVDVPQLPCRFERRNTTGIHRGPRAEDAGADPGS